MNRSNDCLSNFIIFQYTFEEVDITKTRESRTGLIATKYDIPVFHLNGKFLMKHKVNTRLL